MLPSEIRDKLKNLTKVIQIEGFRDKCGIHLEYSNNRYMQEELVGIIHDSIFHFALTKNEYESLKKQDAFGSMRRDSWSRFSKAKALKKGDYGELLLFIFLEHFYRCEKFVTKVRLRSSVQDQIKGYDCAHFTLENEEIILWLGEAKLHKSFSNAITDVVSSINDHVKEEYLKDEISILRTNIEIPEGELKERIESLLRNHASVYKLNIRIPIFIGYEWDMLSSLSEEEMLEKIQGEIEKKLSSIREKKANINTKFSLVFFILPFKDLTNFKMLLEQVENANRIGS